MSTARETPVINTRFSHKRLLASVLTLALCLATGGSAQAQPVNVFAQLQRSTGFVVVNKGSGLMGYGTCWVCDLDNRFVVTNVHVVGTYADVTVAFARYDALGAVLTNSDAYAKTTYIPGKVIYRDAKRDLALIRLTNLPRWTQAIPLAEKSIVPGQKIWSIGPDRLGRETRRQWRPGSGRSGQAGRRRVVHHQ
jgi:S1-C subfamily serine protease